MREELAELGIRKEALAASTGARRPRPGSSALPRLRGAGALRFLELRFPTVLQAR